LEARRISFISVIYERSTSSQHKDKAQNNRGTGKDVATWETGSFFIEACNYWEGMRGQGWVRLFTYGPLDKKQNLCQEKLWRKLYVITYFVSTAIRLTAPLSHESREHSFLLDTRSGLDIKFSNLRKCL
jgi:hypothetical protein